MKRRSFCLTVFVIFVTAVFSSLLREIRKSNFFLHPCKVKKGQELLEQFHLPRNEFNSFVLLENNKAYTRSAGALRIAKALGGGWKLLYAFIIVPKFIRDGVYNWIARNRYKWYGKRDECMIPTPELKERFLG